MFKDIEKAIIAHFPRRWKKSDIVFYMGTPRFELDVGALSENLNKPIRDFILRGGKRVRPILFLTLLDSFGKNYKKYLDYAFFVEVIHNGTLIVDDIEDSSKTRRGKATCHKKFGIDTAINAGNTMYFLPLSILLRNSNGISEKQKLRIWEIYSEEMINVHFGQGIDIYWHKNNPENIKKEKYLEMCRLKTGSLMRMSVRIACALAGKDKKTENIFKKFAESAGVAFQIKDDVLDLVADRKKFGKDYGNDITEGKISLPVVLALKSLNQKEKNRLISILRMHTRNKKVIKEAIDLIKKTEAIDKSMECAQKLLNDSWTEVPKRYRNKDLEEIVVSFIKRDS